jgi:predicted dehydrogenase
MSKLKVGLVGIGRGTAYGKVFAEHPQTEVVALCDFNEEKLAKSIEEFHLPDHMGFLDFNQFIEADMDVVVLGTPIPNHEEEVIASLESGKHVLSEVTVANTISGCQNIYNAVKKAKTKYMMAENCNYMDFTIQWKKYVDQGRLGAIHYAEADYIHEIQSRIIDAETGAEQWRTQRAPIHYCSHSLGPLLHLMDDYIIKTTASGKRADIIKNVGVGAIDLQVALFETQKGAIIKVARSSVTFRNPPLCHYSLYGTKGFIESGRGNYDNVGQRFFHDIDSGPVPIVCSSSDPDASPEMRLGGHGTSEYFLARDFIDSILNDTKPPIDIEKALDMSVPGLVAHEAAMQGNVWLDIPNFWH